MCEKCGKNFAFLTYLESKNSLKIRYFKFSKRGPDTSSIGDPILTKNLKKSNQTKIVTVQMCEVCAKSA